MHPKPAYYNDNDPYCAQWLRNLIAAGHLPQGEVDDRPIQDVRGVDLGRFGQCHFFAGIGGWPFALRLAGWPDDKPVCGDEKTRRIESGTFPLAHGIPNRMGRLRGYGNAIVPQVAAEFIAAYMECRP